MQAESYVGMSPGTEFEVSGKGIGEALRGSASVGKSVGGARATLGASAGDHRSGTQRNRCYTQYKSSGLGWHRACLSSG